MTAAEKKAYPEACQIAENIRILMGRDRRSQGAVSRFVRFTDRTLRNRLERPWEFRFAEIEDIAHYFGCTVQELTRPMRFEE